MFGPGLAWKPGLWPGLGGLGLFKTSGQALMQGLAWPGSIIFSKMFLA